MNQKKLIIISVIIVLTLTIILSYSFLDRALIKFLEEETETARVTRIIDGDTVEINNGTSLRLLGINTPERGEPYFEEAKQFLTKIKNKDVTLEYGKDEVDKYRRVLAYIHFENKNINAELIKQGLANPYFPDGADKYHKSFLGLWWECVKQGTKNLCQKSKSECSECIQLKTRNEFVVIQNRCGFECSLDKWQIKNQGRKKLTLNGLALESNKEFKIPVTQEDTDIIAWAKQGSAWKKSADTLFLRDADGKLVLQENY